MSTTLDPTPRAVWRAARGPLAVAVILIVVAAVVTWANSRAARGELDPAAADAAGSRALAVLLAERGTSVHRVRTVTAALATADAESTIVLVHTDRLPRGHLRRLAGLPGPVVLVAPTDQALQALAPAVRATRRVPVQPRRPECDLPAARVAGPADLGGHAYRLSAGSAPGEGAGEGAGGPLGCYPAGGGVTLARAGVGGRTATVLGDGAPLTNRRLASRGNAALALGLLGETSRLVWLLPSPAPPPAGDADARGPMALLPDGVRWGLTQLAVAVVLLALWRARRIGPVVREPMPVVVRSSEAVEGRARLYAAAGARGQAAQALRVAALTRLGGLLGLPRDAAPAVVVGAVATRTGRTAQAVERLLAGPPPRDDSGLVGLADDLDTLVREVRRE